MSECRWCGTEYEWSDRLGSALCPDCAADSAQDLAEAEATGN
jgi:uncharacterized Zn ribbon protein